MLSFNREYRGPHLSPHIFEITLRVSLHRLKVHGSNVHSRLTDYTKTSVPDPVGLGNYVLLPQFLRSQTVYLVR